MQINLNIVADSPEQVQYALSQLFIGWKPAEAPVANVVAESTEVPLATFTTQATEVPPAPPGTVEVSAPAKRRGRPPRPQTDQSVTDINDKGDAVGTPIDPKGDGSFQGPDEAKAGAIAAAYAQNTPAVTVDEVRAKVKELFALTDENTTFDLIKKHGATSATTLHSSGAGPAFIVEAQALIDQKKAAA